MSGMIHRTLALLAGTIAVATPRLATACAVCLGGTGGGTQRAFAIGSLFLSVLPLRGAARPRQSINFVAVISSPTPAPPIVPARMRRAADQSSVSSA